MDKETIIGKLKDVVKPYIEDEYLEALKNIDHNVLLKDELNVDSVDVVEIVVDVEELFDITIENEEIGDLGTLNEIYELINKKLLLKGEA